MAVFKTADELYQVLGALFDWGSKDPEISKRMSDAGIVVKLNYSDPTACIVIDASKKPVTWHRGDPGVKPDVELSMKADLAHRFWMDKVNLLVALMKKEIVAKGAVTRIMGFLPILKPMFRQYPEILKSIGREDLLKV